MASLGEAQHIEWKTSLSELREGIQSAVAFANSDGGTVFFGIKPDGTKVGVDVGSNTLERLANDFASRIYPDLPVEVHESELPNKKSVIQVEVPADRPPVVGCYLYSPDSLDPWARPSKFSTLKPIAVLGGPTSELISCGCGKVFRPIQL